MCVYCYIFLKVVIANPNALVAALIPTPKYGGDLIFGNSPHEPYPAHLEAGLGQREARKLRLHSWKEKRFAGVISSEQGGWGIVFIPFMPPTLRQRWQLVLGELNQDINKFWKKARPFQLENFQGLSQSLLDVGCIDNPQFFLDGSDDSNDNDGGQFCFGRFFVVTRFDD